MRKKKVEEPKTTVNKKVRNATPIIVDGIQFRSKLEGFVHTELKKVGLPAEYESTKFELLPGFYYKNEKKSIAITWTPDFVGKNFIIECKGFANDAFPLKIKLFKWKMLQENTLYDVYIVNSQTKAKAAIQEILTKNKENDN